MFENIDLHPFVYYVAFVLSAFSIWHYFISKRQLREYNAMMAKSRRNLEEDIAKHAENPTYEERKWGEYGAFKHCKNCGWTEHKAPPPLQIIENGLITPPYICPKCGEINNSFVVGRWKYIDFHKYSADTGSRFTISGRDSFEAKQS